MRHGGGEENGSPGTDGLRVCECGVEGWGRLHKGNPRVWKGGWRGKSRGRHSQTYHIYTSSGNTLDLAVFAHSAYSSWSLMAQNLLIRVMVVEKL